MPISGSLIHQISIAKRDSDRGGALDPRHPFLAETDANGFHMTVRVVRQARVRHEYWLRQNIREATRVVPQGSSSPGLFIGFSAADDGILRNSMLAISVQSHGEGTARGVLASSSADAVLRRRPMATGVRQICEVLPSEPAPSPSALFIKHHFPRAAHLRVGG